MKYTKMMTITTKPVFMGYKMVHAFTIKENEQPEKIIAKLNLVGKVENYEVSELLPLPVAVARIHAIRNGY